MDRNWIIKVFYIYFAIFFLEFFVATARWFSRPLISLKIAGTLIPCFLLCNVSDFCAFSGDLGYHGLLWSELLFLLSYFRFQTVLCYVFPALHHVEPGREFTLFCLSSIKIYQSQKELPYIEVFTEYFTMAERLNQKQGNILEWNVKNTWPKDPLTLSKYV